MYYSATQLHIYACSWLNETRNGYKSQMAWLLSSFTIDYEEKKDTAYVIITVPPCSYEDFASLEHWILTRENFRTLEAHEDYRHEDYCHLFDTSLAFAVTIFDYFKYTPTTLRFIIKQVSDQISDQVSNQASDPSELQPQKTDDMVMLLETPANNQCRQFNNNPNNPIHLWNNLRFNSASEVPIADALDKRKVLFFPNCAVRLGINKGRHNREPDFLVCEKGKWGILEVDGPEFHTPATIVEDHERARLFQAHGILLVQHFDAGECFENADGVVDKFLYLLRNQK